MISVISTCAREALQIYTIEFQKRLAYAHILIILFNQENPLKYEIPDKNLSPDS